jgi:hypothetical protein
MTTIVVYFYEAKRNKNNPIPIKSRSNSQASWESTTSEVKKT